MKRYLFCCLKRKIPRAKQHRPVSASQVCPEILEQENEQCNIDERSRQKESSDMVEELKSNVKGLKKELKKREEEMRKIKNEHFKIMEDKNKEHQRTEKMLQEEISRQNIDIQGLRDANNELLSRLSAMASARLTDGNPNIADLSDGNRPTKLAEQFSELYDNEWTDAYEVLKADRELSEKDACSILLKALCCKDIPPELMKHLKDQRKKNFGGHTKQLKKNLKESIQKLIPDKVNRNDSRTKQFLKKCLDLCWLMAIQDPPVFIAVHITDRHGEVYDSNTLKPYTNSGKYIDYIVWPPLYLYEGGNILVKGIAQGISDVAMKGAFKEPAEKAGKQVTEGETGRRKECHKPAEDSKTPEDQQEAATTFIPIYPKYDNPDSFTSKDFKGSSKKQSILAETLLDAKKEEAPENKNLQDMLQKDNNSQELEINSTCKAESDTEKLVGAPHELIFSTANTDTKHDANIEKHDRNTESTVSHVAPNNTDKDVKMPNELENTNLKEMLQTENKTQELERYIQCTAQSETGKQNLMEAPFKSTLSSTAQSDTELEANTDKHERNTESTDYQEAVDTSLKEQQQEAKQTVNSNIAAVTVTGKSIDSPTLKLDQVNGSDLCKGLEKNQSEIENDKKSRNTRLTPDNTDKDVQMPNELENTNLHEIVQTENKSQELERYIQCTAQSDTGKQNLMEAPFKSTLSSTEHSDTEQEATTVKHDRNTESTDYQEAVDTSLKEQQQEAKQTVNSYIAAVTVTGKSIDSQTLKLDQVNGSDLCKGLEKINLK